MKKNTLLFILVLITIANNLHAQINISGKIEDANSNPVNAVSVRLLNSNKGTLSDQQGNFTINNVAPGNYIIGFSVVGFASKSQWVSIGKESPNIKITLEQTSKRLDEVVVTAQKKEELLQHIPISITSLSDRSVEDYRIWNSRDITGIIPNLYSADPGDKRNVTSVRGIATTSYDPAVATYIDGVNQFSLDTYISPLFDVARIEVLRGPQGTLYGRNAMGGVINIITKQPTNNVSGFAQVSEGNYGTQRYSAGIKAPIIKDKLYVGAAGLYDASSGYFTNEFTNTKYDKQHSIIGNYYLKFLPNSKWAAILNIKHNNNRNNGPFPLVFGAEEALANPYKLSQNALTRIIDNTLNTSLSVNYSGNAFNFTSLTAYQTNYRYYDKPIDADFSPIDGVTLINNYGKDWNNVKVITQEFKFSSPANNLSKLSWTTGTYLFYQTNPTKTNTHFGADAQLIDPNAPVNFSQINSTRAKGLGVAVYGQATYNLTNKLNITGGLRYDYEHKNQHIFGEYQSEGEDPFTYRSDTSSSAHFTAFTPKFSVAYNISSDRLLFATYSRGYRAGGLTPLSSDPSLPALYAYKPEYSNNYEAGIKNTFSAYRIMLNVTAFYTTVTNAQVPTLILPDAVTITKNTGKLNSKGVEVELGAEPAKGFEINYSAGYTDAKYKSLKLSQNNEEANLKGKRQIFTPDLTSMLAAQYSFALSKKSMCNLILRGEWKYIGTQYFDLANTIKQPEYSLFNTRFGVSGKFFDIMFYGRNLFSRKYIAYSYDFGAVHLGDPKTYGIDLKFKF